LERSAAGQSLYQANLGDTVAGTNPFKKNTDTAANITSLMLWNEATSPVQFSDDSQIAMTVIYSGSSAAAFAAASGEGIVGTLGTKASASANGMGISVS
jgi:hypothetical protein